MYPLVGLVISTSICSCVRIATKFAQTTWHSYPKLNWPFFLQKPSTATNFSVMRGACEHLSLSFLSVDWLDFGIHVFSSLVLYRGYCFISSFLIGYKHIRDNQIWHKIWRSVDKKSEETVTVFNLTDYIPTFMNYI